MPSAGSRSSAFGEEQPGYAPAPALACRAKPKPDSFAGVRADVTSTARRQGPFAVAS